MNDAQNILCSTYAWTLRFKKHENEQIARGDHRRKSVLAVQSFNLH